MDSVHSALDRLRMRESGETGGLGEATGRANGGGVPSRYKWPYNENLSFKLWAEGACQIDGQLTNERRGTSTTNREPGSTRYPVFGSRLLVSSGPLSARC